jgi:hypothetical protein
MTGRYEYLGVRLSDAAYCGRTLKPILHVDFSRRNPAYCTPSPPLELTVPLGNTVIKHEPVIEYREAPG